MKETVKLISFDVDGTLLDGDKGNIPISTIKALKKLKENGVILIMASGRTMGDIPEAIEEYFDYFVVGNGGALFDKKKQLLLEIPIDKKDVLELVEYCKTKKKNIGLKTRNHCYYYNYANRIPEYMLREHSVKFIMDTLTIHNEESIVSINFDATSEEVKFFIEKHKNLFFVHGGFDFYEVYHKEADKVRGLKEVLSLTGIKKEECMAFGDSMNDLQALKYVAHGVAMKDSHNCLLNEINNICEKTSDDGIYKYLEKLNVL